MATEFESDGESSEETGNFYEHLPRFVIDVPQSAKDSSGRLYTIERSFEWQRQQFVFSISPARVGGFTVGEDFGESRIFRRFPGAFEESLEQALRRLAAAEKVGSGAKDYTLCFSFTQLSGELTSITGVSSIDRKTVELALETLTNTYYSLKKEGAEEFCFRAVEDLRWGQRNGESNYLVRFAPIFFGIGEFFSS